jgi:WD40 repeat protein
LEKSLSLWRPLAQVKYHTLSDRSWEKQRFVARPLSRPWQGKLQPLLAINESRLFVAAGDTLYSYVFTPSGDEGATPGVSFEASYQFNCQEAATRNDITGLVCAQDGGASRTLFVGFENGELQRVRIPPCNPGQVDLPIDASSCTTFNYHNGELIEALAVSGDSLLSMSINGKAGLLNISSPTPSVQHTIDLDTRAWSALLSTSSSTPFAAFGTSSDTPLAIHAITPTSISAIPTMKLRSSQQQDDSGLERPTAVYGIASAPPASPWGASDQIIVSGWFEGLVCVHDMRVSPTPTLTFFDPWSFEPIYAVACGGGGGARIAAGSARHSVVAFWDVRAAARGGWSVHAPGNDSSPVYSIILESSRLFGATQSRPFVYDFGPTVNPETYPSLLGTRGKKDGLSYKGRDRIGFHVTKYDHPAVKVHAGDH